MATTALHLYGGPGKPFSFSAKTEAEVAVVATGGHYLPPAAVYQVPADYKHPWEKEVSRKTRTKPKSVIEASTSDVEKKLANDVEQAKAPSIPSLAEASRLRELSLRVEFNLANIQRDLGILEERMAAEAAEEQREELQQQVEYEAARQAVWEEALAEMQRVSRIAEDEFMLILAL
jgi:hypothetical protein